MDWFSWDNFNLKAPYEKWEHLWFPLKILPRKPIHLTKQPRYWSAIGSQGNHHKHRLHGAKVAEIGLVRMSHHKTGVYQV